MCEHCHEREAIEGWNLCEMCGVQLHGEDYVYDVEHDRRAEQDLIW